MIIHTVCVCSSYVVSSDNDNENDITIIMMMMMLTTIMMRTTTNGNDDYNHDPYPCAESGGGVPVIPSLLLATSHVVVPHRSRSGFPDPNPTPAAVKGNGPGEPLPPDPHCPGGVG